ncbi:MAG: CDP-alcohol phosphatidyltransferase family protein [Candidatus Saccharicenans sp.]|nr:CDP-alcohol phosphatidyltransferase family protein [Candidatus Saccharicenans sp.]
MEEAVILLSREGQARILGLSLLERLILYGWKAGLKKFWLYSEEDGRARQTVEELRADRRFSPEKMELTVFCPDNERKVAAERNASSHLLVMEDNLAVHPEFFPSLLASSREPAADLILFNRNGSSSPEHSDCRGVFLVKRERIGELLPPPAGLKSEYPGTGDRQEGSFSTGQVTVDCPFFIRVDSPEAAREAEKLLLETGRKPVDSYITRVFFRPISLKLTRNLINLGLTPNQISLIVLAMELVSVYLILQGTYLKMALGGLLFQLSSIVDCCDGENARLTCRVSRFGTIFDVSADAFLFVTFFTALPLGLHRQFGDQLWLYIGAFGLLSMVAFYLQIIYYARRAGIGFHIHPIALEIEASILDPDFQNWADRIASKIAFIYRRDFFTTLAFVLIVLGGAGVLAVMVSGFAFLEAVYFGSWSRRQLKKKSSSQLQPA